MKPGGNRSGCRFSVSSAEKKRSPWTEGTGWVRPGRHPRSPSLSLECLTSAASLRVGTASAVPTRKEALDLAASGRLWREVGGDVQYQLCQIRGEGVDRAVVRRHNRHVRRNRSINRIQR